MDSGLKQRLIGAAVLVALAVIFLPMLVQGPGPDSGVSDVPLKMPDAPQDEYETRDLPLVTPGTAPDGGALGMDRPARGDAGLPTVDTDTADNQPTPRVAGQAAQASSLPAPASGSAMFPPPTAGGDYAVHFGSYTTSAQANFVVNQLRSSQLPGYPERTMLDGKPAYRVRIGPYATRADAEAARLRAAHVRDDVGARVIALDADAVVSKPAPPAPVASVLPATALPAKPAASPKPASPPAAASSIGFAVQLGAFSKEADAQALRDRVRAAGFSAFTESVDTDKGALTRVRVGPVASRVDADALKAQLRAKVGVDGIVRPHP